MVVRELVPVEVHIEVGVRGIERVGAREPDGAVDVDVDLDVHGRAQGDEEPPGVHLRDAERAAVRQPPKVVGVRLAALGQRPVVAEGTSDHCPVGLQVREGLRAGVAANDREVDLVVGDVSGAAAQVHLDDVGDGDVVGALSRATPGRMRRLGADPAGL